MIWGSYKEKNMGMAKVITTLNNNGVDVMGPRVLGYKYPDSTIVSGSLLTVESNHFAVLKSRGAVLKVYTNGQFQITTPDKPLVGSLMTGFFGGTSPWQYEIIYINRAKLIVSATGVATSLEMAEMSYTVDFYIHVDNEQDAVKLITHMPFAGEAILSDEVAMYAKPVIEQSINQIVQVTPMEKINEHIHDITELLKNHLGDFLDQYGIHLNDVKVLITPKDERMRELISLRAIGLTPLEAVRYYTALEMAKRGLVSAPNMAIGAPFNVGSQVTTPVTLDSLQGNSKA